jgi:ATP-binding cassette subfamily B protein
MFRREAVNGDRFQRTGLAYRSAVNGTIFLTAASLPFWSGCH